MLRYPPTPPPPRGARQLTVRLADPQGLGQPGGRPPPPYDLHNRCFAKNIRFVQSAYCFSWLYMDCPEMFDSTRQNAN